MPNIENKHPIREDWEEYYKFLEALRRTGVVNMFGSGPYLQECFPKLLKEEINEIFLSWAENYQALNQKYGWQNP
jgi:hypothetical protein